MEKNFAIADFKKLRENNQIEAKAAVHGLPQSLWETYSSFANTEGGYLLIGVKENQDKSFSLSHTPIIDQLLKDFWSGLNNPNKVSINLLTDKDVRVIEKEDGNYIVIHVPQARREEKPVYINGNVYSGTYRRDYEGDYHCSELEIKSMISESLQAPYDSELLSKDLSILEQNTIQNYRNEFASVHPSHPWLSLSDEEFLYRLGALGKEEDGKLMVSKAGLLFFGKDYEITRFYPNYFLDYQENSSEHAVDRYRDRLVSFSGDWSGNLHDFLILAFNRISQRLPTPFQLKDGFQRNDDTELKEAVREALCNAISNADFTFGHGIVVHNYPSKLVIINPGLLLVPLKQALQGGVSSPRNQIILKMLNLINIGERSGSGIPIMEKAIRDCADGKLTITQDYRNNLTTLILPFRKEEEHTLLFSLALPMRKETLDKTEQFLLSLKPNQEFSKKEMVAATKLSSSTVQNLLKALYKHHVIMTASGYEKGRYLFVKDRHR